MLDGEMPADVRSLESSAHERTTGGRQALLYSHAYGLSLSAKRIRRLLQRLVRPRDAPFDVIGGHLQQELSWTRQRNGWQHGIPT